MMMLRRRLMQSLNLTDAQKQQATEIFQASRQQARPLAQQLRQYRQDLRAAVQSGAPGEKIDELTTRMGPLMAQMAGIHAKAFQKFYATLTPEQQQKVGQRLDHFLGGGRMGHQAGAGRLTGRNWHPAPQQ